MPRPDVRPDLRPDLLVTNARVLTMDPDLPRAEAVALAGGRIAAVGPRRAVEALAGPATAMIDAGGATLLPGFVESHMHLFAGAAELDHLHLGAGAGAEAIGAAIRAHAAARPDLPLVVAQGGHHGMLGPGQPAPARHDLDAMLPDRPLAIVAFDHHTVWANTAALTAAGLMDGATLPPGNEVVLGPDGSATGELREAEAFAPVMAIGGAARATLGLRTGGEPDPAPSPAERALDRALLRRGLAHAAAHGITSIVNMDGNRYTLELLAEIEAGGGLLARVRVPFHFKPAMAIDALDRAAAMARDFRSDTLASGFVKLFLDGVLDGFTAVLLEDYADRPGWRGAPLFAPERFAAIATEADRRGLQVAVHAIGDGAVRIALDGFAAARAANGARDSRHRIEHAELVHPADLPRFAALGIVASMQPPHPPGCGGLGLEPTLSRIGRARWPQAYAWRSLAEAGARLAFASDWPVSPISVLSGIGDALARRPWGSEPDQRIGLMATLAAYTAGGAHAAHAEDRRGMIRAGLLGDLVLLDGDIEAEGPGGLGIALTVMGGRITHRA